jgi:hypothetical protein
MLATLIASGVSKVNSQTVTFNTTDDGLSLAGMFFARLETMHAEHISGALGKVRPRYPQHNKCYMLMNSYTRLQTELLRSAALTQYNLFPSAFL